MVDVDHWVRPAEKGFFGVIVVKTGDEWVCETFRVTRGVVALVQVGVFVVFGFLSSGCGPLWRFRRGSFGVACAEEPSGFKREEVGFWNGVYCLGFCPGVIKKFY